MADELRFLFYAATLAVGELVVRTAAILIALSAIVTIVTKFVRWAGTMSRNVNQLVELSRTGDQRLKRIEDTITPPSDK